MTDTTCPECGSDVHKQLTLNGYVPECRNCGWYDPDP